MALTKDEVEHLAKLSRLDLSTEEIERFTTQFGGIFKQLDLLQEVDTEGVEETAQVTGLKNVMQDDVLGETYDRDDLLAVSEREKARGMLRVKKSI